MKMTKRLRWQHSTNQDIQNINYLSLMHKNKKKKTSGCWRRWSILMKEKGSYKSLEKRRRRRRRRDLDWWCVELWGCEYEGRKKVAVQQPCYVSVSHSGPSPCWKTLLTHIPFISLAHLSWLQAMAWFHFPQIHPLFFKTNHFLHMCLSFYFRKLKIILYHLIA